MKPPPVGWQIMVMHVGWPRALKPSAGCPDQNETGAAEISLGMTPSKTPGVDVGA
jgi:hypothetical protein